MKTRIKNEKYVPAIFLTILITFCGQNLAYGVNEAPNFTDGDSTTRAVAENTASGVNIGTPVAATDADNDTLTYSLSGPDAPSFRIISTSGQIRTRARLNYETKRSYAVSVSVSDGNDGSDSIPVTINVTDLNENRAPVFKDGDSATRFIAENTASGQSIGTPVAATDADNDTLTYSLGGTDASSFSIVSTTGQLQTNAALDYETKSAYAVTVSVSDGNGGSNSIAVPITVTDAGEKPVFAPGGVTLTVAENAASGRNIGAPITATDPDSGDTLTYSLRRGDADSFSIDANTGQVRTKVALDYETKNAYTDLAVRATDSTGLIGATRVTINVTDVAEATITSPLSTRTPAVRDAIVAAVPDINNANGVTAAHLAAITSLDLSSRSISSLKTGDFNGLTALFSLLLHNNSISDISLLEDLTSGSLVFLVLGNNSISDISPLEGLTSLLSLSLGNYPRNGISVGNNSISDISPLEGLTSMKWLNLGNNSISDISPLEDLTSLLSLDLKNNSISDISPLEDLISIKQIFLNGNKITDISVLENLTKLQHILLGSNSISDISVLENLTSLETLYLDGNSINDISVLEGLTSLETLQLQGNPISDYGPLRRLKVANPSVSIDIDINININNNPPVFTDGATTTRSIAENTASGTNIGAAVSATDTDTSDTLTYSLGGTDADSFSIVSTSGQLQTKAALDYETQSSYTVTVDVSDGNDGLDSITVTINVTDAAGAAPSVETSPVIPANTELLTNFPNPFNPETWIPYQLAKPAEVTLTLYDIRGVVVRRLQLGYQAAGFYQSRSRAIHWDGRNNIGEKVASGVYFYTLKAGEFTATQKLLIRK